MNILKRILKSHKKFIKENIIWVMIAEVIFWSPVIWFAILGIFVDRAYLGIVATIIAFWTGPFTPAIELQLGLAVLLKTIYKAGRKIRKEVKKEMKTESIKIVKETFQEIADLVTPTMGAKGRFAVIGQDFDRPSLTDDGVTVAREARRMTGFKKMVAISMIEAASNTEKEAYDGTTLTVLLTNEFYKTGLRWIKRGMHPQLAADRLVKEVNEVREELTKHKIEKIDRDIVKSIATISTKIPIIGEIVAQAYEVAGDDMNIIIEHSREGVTGVEHIDGMVLESGYMSEIMQSLCNQDDKTVMTNAHLVLLSEGMLTQGDTKEFFRSIPQENMKDPFVFFITPNFNPESLKLLIDTLIQNKFIYQFVFLNEENVGELFLDIAAKTNGFIQDSNLGTSDYKFEHCGLAGKIIIEQNKTTILDSDGDVSARIKSYKKELKKNKFKIGSNRIVTVTRRLSALEKGITKIKLGAATVTEYTTIKMKLDDAIGAVKCTLQHGALLGAGKALFTIGRDKPVLKKALQKPLKTILKNAGLRYNKKIAKKYETGIDVKTGKLVNLYEEGIIDSYDSIDIALKNAVSISSNYLRAFILISKD